MFLPVTVLPIYEINSYPGAILIVKYEFIIEETFNIYTNILYKYNSRLPSPGSQFY